MANVNTSDRADLVATEVLRYALAAAADQMRLALKRTAFSPIIYEVCDFAVGLYDRQVRLLAQGHGIPMFLGTLSFSIEAALEHLGGEENVEPGDVIFSTYGYDIGSHQQDAAVILPAFFEDELVGYAAVKAHHMDIGAKAPYCTDTTDIFQEGTIFPSVKLYTRGKLQRDLYRTLLANSRLPTELAGDLNAEIGAARVGLQGLERILRRYQLEGFTQGCERMFDQSEATLRKKLEAVPDGRYVGSGAIDSNGVDDNVIPFEVAIEISGSDVTVDFSMSPPEQPGPINCPLATTVSAARLAVMAFAAGRESPTEGHFRSIRVVTREGTLFHPRPPAPIYMYFWPPMIAVDLIFRALADAMPDAVPAGSGGDVCNISWWGRDADGSLWIHGTNHYVGQGAAADGDGGPPLMHITGSGIRNTPVEVWESLRPAIIEKFEYATDSGGSGQFRGGLGVDVHYRLLRDCSLTLPWDRTKTPPWGLHGGGEARANRFAVRDPSGSVTEYGKVTSLPIRAGSVVEVCTGGGGGFGPPEAREATAVHADVRDGYVSEAAAHRNYPHAFMTDKANL